MSDSISGVIIPLIIPVDAPPSLASGVQALAASLESTEFSSACLQLQQSFCYLTWHFADFSARHLQHLGLEFTACSAFGHSRLDQHLEALQDNLERLAEAAEKHPEVGDVFRVFYVGGLRARSSSPRRHTRLLGLGGQSIRGYRSVAEWCRLELGDEEFSGELRCQRELRRYLPILREWLDSSSGHFRQIKGYDWFDQSSTDPAPEAEAPVHPTPTASASSDALASLKTPVTEAPAVVTLTSFPTPTLFARHQALFEEQSAAQDPVAFITLGRLAGLAVQYIFAIAGAALRSIGQLDPALEKRLETGLTLRQKQTSLTFLFKGLAQHQNENPMLEQVTRAVQAPTGGKLADFLTSTWGGGHTFAEFCLETAKPEPPPLWQERFLPGIRAWLQQTASWFAHAEHYFQPPNEQGFISFTLQLGDEHLEIDRKALQLDTAALRISASELKQLLIARSETSGEDLPAVAEPPKVVPEKVEAAKAEATKAEPAKAERAKAEAIKAEPAKTEPAKAEAIKAEPAKKEPAKAEATKAEPAKAEPAKAEAIKAEPAKKEPAKAEATKAEPAKAEPAKAEATKAEPSKTEPAKAEVTKAEPAKAEPAKVEAPEAEPAKTEPTKAEPAKIEPVKAEAPEAEPAKAKPAKAKTPEAEPVKTEPVKAEAAKTEPLEAKSAQAETTEAEPVKAEPAKAEPVESEPTDAKTAKADPAKVEAVQAEVAEAEAAEARPETVKTEEPAQPEAPKAELEAVDAEIPSVAAPLAEPVETTEALAAAAESPQSAGAQEWSGPALALELWDQAVETSDSEPLLRLVAFLIQYTSGVTAEWRELEEKSAPANISSALDQVLERLQTSDDSPVLTPLGASDQPDSLHHWLQQPELRNWLTSERDFHAQTLKRTGDWLASLQPFFQDSEQLFEDPAECGTLEGVVVFQDRFLEFVDHPIYVGPTNGKFWEAAAAETPESKPTPVEAPLPEAEPAVVEEPMPVVEATAVAPTETTGLLDTSALPDCVTEYYESLWSTQPIGLEGLAAVLEFSIQYYAGLWASVAINAGATEASHLSAWRGDSNLLQRVEMIQQVLKETQESDHTTLVSLRSIFEGPGFGELWSRESSELVSLAYALRTDHEEERGRAETIAAAWIEAARPLLATLENLAEPIDAKGHLEVVVQQDDNFFELVEPEYAVHLVPPGYKNWQDLICYRNLAARYGSQELFGTSDGSQELSGSAVTDDGEDFFSAPSLSLQDKMMEALFKEPDPTPPPVKLDPPKAKPQLVQQEEETVAPTPRSELQLNAVLEQLLQKPAEEEAPPAPPPAAEETPTAAPVAAKPEASKGPARLDAPQSTEKVPEFIVVDPPKLQYTIHYDGKEGQIHAGRIELKNVGGSLLKGTVKSNHPCLRVNPSVFRTNEAEINYWIDDSDRPSNMQKIGLSFHFSGQKVEVPMEKMLPDKKFKQLASKMLGFVKNLRQKG
ncbi:MAG: hypothetical protein J0I12_00125 [Candidatus Eremiobacteraeota bacterium]|nr:hypothetical protein [Candidatus Eremiobacteraeota bacterium]